MVSIIDRRESRMRFRGFASMPREKVLILARLGGRVRAERLGHEGYVALGKKGGATRAQQLGQDGLKEMGRRGSQRKRGRSPSTRQAMRKGATLWAR